MYVFDYHRPNSLADAHGLLTAREDAKILAGGMTLIPTLKQRLAQPSDLIDLSACPGLSGITLAADSLTIGAMTCHAAVAANPQVISALPALASLAAGIGDPAVRNRGTLGGSIANDDPAADWPAACLGLGATILTDTREIAAEDFFLGLFETALEPAEIITAVRFPLPLAAAYAKFDQPASRFALVGVFVARTAAGSRVAVTGASQEGVFRAGDLEKALDRDFSAAALEGVRVSPARLNEDIHGDGAYRAHLIGVMAGRAVSACQ
ncbi:carbon monoxide dehydrogenase [Rhodospirillum rubrum]|uniref:FAD binding domain-containing protein n=1 Tax=Rhodospirillum rubrum TaxID=1085 RepID=UPI0019074DE4|nr:xanthine dehydrogenase family protein subunit M [Rhodospirillum rubrum]MBK1663958.1 carbon monoxide dehydrogenase [Rhodospirillum rubrum]MBK1676592.1 carbon monoxide dehydrogenase [Rhodospirillum rubrum]